MIFEAVYVWVLCLLEGKYITVYVQNQDMYVQNQDMYVQNQDMYIQNQAFLKRKCSVLRISSQ